ncbi:MAG: L,D-transpeptidase family protein [Rhizobiaceae bacterium]
MAAATAEKPAAKPAAKKQTVKKKKKTQVAKKPAPEPEKPKGLFSSLFKPAEPEKPAKPLTKAEKAKIAKEKAAREKAEKAERLAAEKAAKNARIAAEKARQEKIRAAEEAEFNRVKVLAAAAKSNDGELRSETQEPQGLFGAVFGTPKTILLPETKALDAALAVKDKNRKFKVKEDYAPQRVSYSGYSRGQIVIDTDSRYLYLIESSTSARRYAIAVGKDGLQFKGKVMVGDKQEWPRWIPTKEMQQRDPAKYGQYADGMAGGPENPLGARAIYLYQGKKDTHLRIHGTNQPETIGTSASNGCFRMVNDHVIDLYTRVKKGTEVIVL